MSQRRTYALVLIALALFALGTAPFRALEPIVYRVSMPEPQHHWMQVEVSFRELASAPLELRVSRSSPGRYSLHDFAKNVYDIRAYGANGREIPAVRTDPHGWSIADHGGAAAIQYKVFGDRVDGTYLAIDTTHAHINMPAAVMWARGHEERPLKLVFEPPAGQRWQVATQLYPGTSPFEFTAPNLQYLMDSPVELGPGSIGQFAAGDRAFRVALHHTGTAADAEALVRDTEKIVRVAGDIFGEYPAYEPGHYTFIVDWLPYASGDAMEHRNSTVLTSPTTWRTNRLNLLDGVAHEFFHGWNVERIRPRSLEPFDFERANMSGELWLAEGFTQYYAPIVLSRAGLADLQSTVTAMADLVTSVALNPARFIRSAEEMSRMAPFTDGVIPVDRTNWPTTVISYYEFGGAVALALDLTLRDRSEGRVTLDDYMRAMWRAHGRGGSRPGYVDHPYTAGDAEARLAEVSGDAAFARDFFARYIQGHDVADYGTLLGRAGLLLRKANAGRAWWGDMRLHGRNGAVSVASPPARDTPAYAAGLDVDDEVRELDGSRITSGADVEAMLRRHRPGDTIKVVFADRAGIAKTASMTLAEDPQLELLPIESTRGSLTPAQTTFRRRWLGL